MRGKERWGPGPGCKGEAEGEEWGCMELADWQGEEAASEET